MMVDAVKLFEVEEEKESQPAAWAARRSARRGWLRFFFLFELEELDGVDYHDRGGLGIRCR